jgi:hypothetical protein
VRRRELHEGAYGVGYSPGVTELLRWFLVIAWLLVATLGLWLLLTGRGPFGLGQPWQRWQLRLWGVAELLLAAFFIQHYLWVSTLGAGDALGGLVAFTLGLVLTIRAGVRRQEQKRSAR